MNEPSQDREDLILHACHAAANVMASRGIEPEDIANGLIAFGGAMALEMIGAQATAEIFQSKADGLVDVIQ